MVCDITTQVGSVPFPTGQPGVAVFPPSAVSIFLTEAHGSPRNSFAVTITDLEPHGDGIRVRAGEGGLLSADITTAWTGDRPASTATTPKEIDSSSGTLANPAPRRSPRRNDTSACVTGRAYASEAGTVRVVSLLPSTTEILFALGAGDDVVGVTFECDHPAEARTRTIVSTSALPEGLDAAGIDAFVAEAMRAGSGGSELGRRNSMSRPHRPSCRIRRSRATFCSIRERASWAPSSW